MGTVSFIDSRLVPSTPLPAGFEYPEAFLRYLLFEERERGYDPDSHMLRWIWPSELHHEEGRVAHVLRAYVDKGANEPASYLVPFAQDFGDVLWFFTPDGIQFIDMGWKVWIPRPEHDQDFTTFVNRQRAGAYLPPWQAGA